MVWDSYRFLLHLDYWRILLALFTEWMMRKLPCIVCLCCLCILEPLNKLSYSFTENYPALPWLCWRGNLETLNSPTAWPVFMSPELWYRQVKISKSFSRASVQLDLVVRADGCDCGADTPHAIPLHSVAWVVPNNFNVKISPFVFSRDVVATCNRPGFVAYFVPYGFSVEFNPRGLRIPMLLPGLQSLQDRRPHSQHHAE